MSLSSVGICEVCKRETIVRLVNGRLLCNCTFQEWVKSSKVKCKHPVYLPMMNWSYTGMKAKCRDCGEIVEFSKVQVTGYKELFSNLDSIETTETTITYRNRKGE